MERRILSTVLAPSSPLFSQGIQVGSHVYVSGMTGMDVTTSTFGATVQDQTIQALRNCAAVIAEAGGNLDNVVQVTVLLARPEDFAGMNEAYATVFASTPPTRAVAKLGVELPEVLVSIMMTAHLDS